MAFDRKRRSSATKVLHQENPTNNDEDSDLFVSAADALLKLGSFDRNFGCNDQQQLSRKNRKRQKRHITDGSVSSPSSSPSSRQGLGVGGEVAVIFREQAGLAPFGAVPRRHPYAVSDDEEENRDGKNHLAAELAVRFHDYNVNNRIALSSRLGIIREGGCATSFLRPSPCSWVAKPLAPPPRLVYALGQLIPLQSRIADEHEKDKVSKNLPSSTGCIL